MIKDPFVLYYFAFPLILLLMMVTFLNRKEIKTHFWFGLIWGTVVTTLIIFMVDHVLNLVKYRHVYPFTILNLPFLFDLAWTPAILLFLHFLPRKEVRYAYHAYLITFCLINAANDEIFHQIGLLDYIHWNPFCRFLISVPYFYWLAIHYSRLAAKGAFKET